MLRESISIFTFKNQQHMARHRWLILVNLATQEADIGRIEANPGK
jgi:hypothetical protein